MSTENPLLPWEALTALVERLKKEERRDGRPAFRESLGDGFGKVLDWERSEQVARRLADSRKCSLAVAIGALLEFAYQYPDAWYELTSADLN